MKATVIQKFQDKLTGEHFTIGQSIDVNRNRLNELVSAGVVEAEEELADFVAEPLKKKKTQSKR